MTVVKDTKAPRECIEISWYPTTLGNVRCKGGFIPNIDPKNYRITYTVKVVFKCRDGSFTRSGSNDGYIPVGLTLPSETSLRAQVLGLMGNSRAHRLESSTIANGLRKMSGLSAEEVSKLPLVVKRKKVSWDIVPSHPLLLCKTIGFAEEDEV